MKDIYRALLFPRTIEEKMLRLIRQNRLSKWFSAFGQEASSVGCALALRPDDYIFPTHRNLGIWTTREVPLKPLFCQLMGRAGGYTKGRDRTFHFGLMEKNIIGMISHMAAMLPVACGVGWAFQLKKEDRVGLVFCGDGASREGDFHEALNLASVWKLPVLFVIENNGYGLSTPTRDAVPVEDIALAAKGYGMPGVIVDGNDVLAVKVAVEKAAKRARKGEGPTLIEVKTFRLRGHEEASGTKYVPADLIGAWSQKDPVRLFELKLLQQGVLTQEEMDAIRRELVAIVEEAAEYALTQPMQESTAEQEQADIFAPVAHSFTAPTGSTTEKRFVDAVSDGLRQAMEQDEKVIIFGQDVAEYGGVFKVTEGFLNQFGPARVCNTPIIESGAVGAAMGLALEGYKPVLEMQYADFITCGFNQIVNNLATTHYRWGTPLNVTIRAPFGGNVGAGPFHSQSIEAWFCHVPGLKVFAPSSPQDVKGLLLSAIQDPNPVLFFEHKYLYRSVRGPVTDAPFMIEPGKAAIVREGTDATVVTYGLGVHWAMEEAAYQEQRGVSLEVIDLRTLIPWDRQTVLASLQKTSRVVIFYEATYTGGFGAEVAATIAYEGFSLLDAPPVRVAAEDWPVPFSINLEKNLFSAQSKLRPAIENVLAY